MLIKLILFLNGNFTKEISSNFLALLQLFYGFCSYAMVFQAEERWRS